MQRLTGSLPTWRLWAYYYSAIAWYLHDVLTMRVTILVPYLLTVLVVRVRGRVRVRVRANSPNNPNPNPNPDPNPYP